ncbi:Transposon TX1 uncharacterized protein [Merluccius polli]|uniref:Transposon TX1 uncharacterized protein n=1 Tax=Merluccius polli TaxID=89951 RepID=A0AA47MVH4_MERPO|nr:Transposon TX1 uncharacterized protein [Merluccius polli]
MSDLEIEMVELQNAVESTGDRGHFEVLKSKKNMLEDLLGIRAQGALVRSRFQSANLMDAPSSFFFGLEKRSGQSKFVHTLRSADGHEITETAEIRREAVSFYSGLYRSEYRENEQLFTSLCDGLPKIAAEENPNLGEPLTMRELCTALQSMKGGKAPGIDGLTVDFYKAFWEELGEDFLSVVNESFKEKTLPYSCRRAAITLLPKKGDLQDIKNWRPVSLLCTDYKILSKALANRLREVLEQVIHQDQTYCVPSRSIVDNVSLIRDVLDVSSSLGLDVGFISMDQEKAFDRVEHLYLWKIMEWFGLNPGLIAMIKVLYQDIESVLKINGGLSAPFIVKVLEPAASLYWLLEEPLVGGARMDIQDSSTPSLTHTLCTTGLTTLRRLVDAAGPGLMDVHAVAALMGLKSVRHMEYILKRWSERLSVEDFELLRIYWEGEENPDAEDPFPDLELYIDFDGCSGLLLDTTNENGVDLYTVGGYRRSDAVKWQLLNFLLGEAKMALYLTRRNKIKNEVMQDVLACYVSVFFLCSRGLCWGLKLTTGSFPEKLLNLRNWNC